MRTLITGFALTVVVFLLLPGRTSPYATPALDIRKMLEQGQVDSAVKTLEGRIRQDREDLQARRELVMVMALQPAQLARPVLAEQFRGELKTQELDHQWFYSLARHPDAVVRANVVTCIGDARLESGFRVARKLAYDSTKEVRVAATRALGQLGDPAARRHLYQALKDGDWHVRSVAADALGKVPGEPRLVHSLFLVTEDEDDYVRYWALKSLIAHATPQNEAQYRERLEGNPGERLAAILALVHTGDLELVPALQEVLLQAEGKDREIAARTLAKAAPELTADWLKSAQFANAHSEVRDLLESYLKDGAALDDIVSGATSAL